VAMYDHNCESRETRRSVKVNLFSTKLKGRHIRDSCSMPPVSLVCNRLEIKNVMATTQALAKKKKSEYMSLTFEGLLPRARL
jgi:hypothetical protein